MSPSVTHWRESKETNCFACMLFVSAGRSTENVARSFCSCWCKIKVFGGVTHDRIRGQYSKHTTRELQQESNEHQKKLWSPVVVLCCDGELFLSRFGHKMQSIDVLTLDGGCDMLGEWNGNKDWVSMTESETKTTEAIFTALLLALRVVPVLQLVDFGSK